MCFLSLTNFSKCYYTVMLGTQAIYNIYIVILLWDQKHTCPRVNWLTKLRNACLYMSISRPMKWTITKKSWCSTRNAGKFNNNLFIVHSFSYFQSVFNFVCFNVHQLSVHFTLHTYWSFCTFVYMYYL